MLRFFGEFFAWEHPPPPAVSSALFLSVLFARILCHKFVLEKRRDSWVFCKVVFFLAVCLGPVILSHGQPVFLDSFEFFILQFQYLFQAVCLCLPPLSSALVTWQVMINSSLRPCFTAGWFGFHIIRVDRTRSTK